MIADRFGTDITVFSSCLTGGMRLISRFREVVASIAVRSIKWAAVSITERRCVHREMCESRVQRSLVNTRTQCRQLLGVAATRPSGTGSIKTTVVGMTAGYGKRPRCPGDMCVSGCCRPIRFSIVRATGHSALMTIPNASWNNRPSSPRDEDVWSGNDKAQTETVLRDTCRMMRNACAALQKVKRWRY